MVKVRSGRLWVGTIGSGLIEIDRRRRVVVAAHRPGPDPSSLSNNEVYSVLTPPRPAGFAGHQHLEHAGARKQERRQVEDLGQVYLHGIAFEVE